MTGTCRNKVFFFSTAILLSFSLSLNSPARAADGDVRIAGTPVFTMQSGAGASLQQRAETIQNNLDNALVASQDRSSASVGVTYVHGMPVVTLGGYQVVTVDQSDATVANTSPAALAQQWSDGIRQALGNKSSIDSYVSQLSGGAPPSSSSAPTQGGQTAYSPPNTGAHGGYDQYNAGSGPGYNGNTGGFGVNPMPSTGGYSGQPQGGGYNNGQPNGYGGPSQGYPPQGGYNGAPYGGGGYGSQPINGYRQGRIAYAPAGQVIPVTLQTSISTQVAHTGDIIQASLSQAVMLGDSQIPRGSVLVGQVTEAQAGRRLARSGELGIKFTSIRTPDGTETPITAHLVGGIQKYHPVAGQVDTVKGEGLSNKVGSVAFRGLIGAGGGAALGTGVGAIAGGGYGAGMGAWSGAAIGGGLGVADSLLLRKGKDVTIKSGTNMQVQLDAPVSVAGAAPAGVGPGGY
jgi:hypothetical protein